MRVLIVTKKRKGGGTEKHVADIVAGLNGRIDIEAAYLEDGFWPLERQIKRGNYHVVHLLLPRPYVMGSIACWLAGHKTRIMSRRSLAICYQTPMIRWIEKRLHKGTKILVGNSPAVVDELRGEAPKSDIRLIRNGVNGGITYHVKSNVFRMLCVANGFSYKGHDDLIAAVCRIWHSLPYPWVLNLVGTGTEKYAYPPAIVSWGFSGDLAAHWAQSDLFILPSHGEGSSNALLEAMAAGVPVIATDVGGNKDAVCHGETGLLVPPQDPKGLSEAIEYMVRNPAKRFAMAAMAKADVGVRFGMDRMLNEYEAMYRSTVPEHPWAKVTKQIEQWNRCPSER